MRLAEATISLYYYLTVCHFVFRIYEALRYNTPCFVGRTSKATKHLKEVHGLISEKTSSEISKKTSREELVEWINNSDLRAREPKRLRLLLEAQRIVYNNLSFCFGDYKESKVRKKKLYL